MSVPARSAPLRSAVARVGRIGGATLVGSVSTVALTVVLARVLSLGDWSAIAVGQSVGAVGAIAVSLGWTVNGPSEVAVLAPSERLELYRVSLLTRLATYAVVGPCAALVVLVLLPGRGLLGMAVALATCLIGLSPRWFSLGVGSGGDLFRYDVLPVVAANTIGAVAVVGGASPYVYPALLAVGSVAGCARFTAVLHARVGRPPQRPDWRGAWPAWLAQRTVAASELLLTGFAASAIALASTRLSEADTAQFAADFRQLQWALLAVYVLTQGTQGWVVEPGGSHRARLRQVLAVHVTLGLVGGVLLALLLPALSLLLFGEALQASPATSAWLGLAFAATSVSTGVGTHVLVVFGLARMRLVAAAVMVTTGVVLIVLLSQLRGPEGAAAAMATAIGLGCLVQIGAAFTARQVLPVS